MRVLVLSLLTLKLIAVLNRFIDVRGSREDVCFLELKNLEIVGGDCGFFRNGMDWNGFKKRKKVRKENIFNFVLYFFFVN